MGTVNLSLSEESSGRGGWGYDDVSTSTMLKSSSSFVESIEWNEGSVDNATSVNTNKPLKLCERDHLLLTGSAAGRGWSREWWKKKLQTQRQRQREVLVASLGVVILVVGRWRKKEGKESLRKKKGKEV
ncbi:hypothetical protein LR48_Vigan09g093600 [Vigna angularis]|uniref:Uncharacterized protein n=1 Tax=Phaseolus angularis TaxID=3914 RepID=A0A0L9VBH2_PHAAN|nr:hypothetical protein LR48_Vigan09g093600 [Vigna angularis]